MYYFNILRGFMITFVQSSIQQGIQAAAYAGLFDDVNPKSMALTAVIDNVNGVICTAVIQHIPLTGLTTTLLLHSAAYAVRYLAARALLSYLDKSNPKRVAIDIKEITRVTAYGETFEKKKGDLYPVYKNIDGTLIKYMLFTAGVGSITTLSNISKGLGFVSGMWQRFNPS